MRFRIKFRLIGLVAAGLLLLAATPAKAAPAEAGKVWRTECPAPVGTGKPFCTAAATAGFHDNRGVAQKVALTLHIDAACVSLHVDLPAVVDEWEAAWIQVDGGVPHPFYRPAELKDLADALDESRPPAKGVAPELAGFWKEVQAGAVGARDAATAELIARFARLKQGRKLGIGCEATARLMPALLAGTDLRVGFSTAPRTSPQPYHWAVRERREVNVRLGDLQPALDSLPDLR